VLETDVATNVAGEQAAPPAERFAAERRPRRSGFVNVILVVGVLAALAVPSYLSHVQRAEMQKAESNLARASADAETYYARHGTYAGLGDPRTGLRLLDPGLGSGVSAVIVTSTRFCLKSIEGHATAWIEGPAGTATDTKPPDCS
jgi:type II secretory pathway pseudopilin PulG